MASLKFLGAQVIDAPRPVRDAARRLIVSGLRSASAALARWSRRLVRAEVRAAQPLPQLEFYAEAGAPEGALYFDGQLVGRIRGVQRL